jgi:hypothetical protein
MAPRDARTEPKGSGTGINCLAALGPARLPLLLRIPDPAAAVNDPAALSANGLSAEACEALKLLLLLVVVVVGVSKTSLPPMLEVRGRITTRMGPLWPWAARARSCYVTQW